MKELIFSNEILLARKQNISMYRKLGEICLTLKGKQESIPVIVGMKDVGAGKGPRYQPSCAEFLDELVVKLYVKEMLELNIQASSNMRSLNQGDDLRKLIEVQRYTSCLQMFQSIGPVRSQAICQLTALFGLIPLDFYSYLPMHLSGGPGNFLRDLMGFDTNFDSKVKENNALLEWNVKTVTTLQKLYNKELTYNKFENVTCEISRQNVTNDFFYYLPWLDENGTCIVPERLQLFFRVHGNKTNQWSLEAFDGKKRHCIFSDNPRNSPLLKWERSSNNGAVKMTHNLKINKGSSKLATIFKH